MSGKKSGKVAAPKTRDDVAMVLAAWGACDAQLRGLLAELDAVVSRERARIAPEVERLQGRLNALGKAAAKWARENPDEFPKDQRHIQMVTGRIGFRVGNWTAKLARGVSEETAVALLRKARPALVRTLEEPNWEAIIAAREELPLAELGLVVDRAERFYLEPDASKPLTDTWS